MDLAATIVIPTFNRAHLLSRAIDSALQQTLACEVLLVDHGSTDETPFVAASYGDRIRYIRRAVDRGPVACWLDGAQQASGEYLHFTYDDDWIQPNFMQKCVACFKNDVGVVYSRATLRDPDSGCNRTIVRHPPGKHPSERLIQHLMAAPLPISPGCAVFRRKDVLANLLDGIPGATGRYGVRSGVGEDLLLFLLTCNTYANYVHIGEPLADFLEHPGSITINAIGSGRSRELVEAYSIAKAHFLDISDYVPQSVPARFLSRIKWRLQSMVH